MSFYNFSDELELYSDPKNIEINEALKYNPYEPQNRKVSSFFSKLRVSKGVLIKDLASILKINPMQVTKLENTTLDNISIADLLKYTRALGCKVKFEIMPFEGKNGTKDEHRGKFKRIKARELTGNDSVKKEHEYERR